MIIYCDIDETICFYKEELSLDSPKDYNLAVPSQENIAKINKLYDEGHTIVYYTARGSRSSINWREFTIKQLQTWGAKFHDINCHKPYYDVLIDDRAKRIEEI